MAPKPKATASKRSRSASEPSGNTNEDSISLYKAADEGDLQAAVRLIAKGANVNVRSDIYIRRTPLIAAVEVNSLPIIKALIANGADVNASNCDDWTALHCASAAGYTAAIELLLSVKGIDLNAKTSVTNCTPLLLACKGVLAPNKTEREAAIEALVAAGADATLPDCEGMTPLHTAAKYNSISSAYTALLNAKGVDVDALDKEGRTPLMVASESGATFAVESLIRKGANVKVSDDNGLTALHFSANEAITKLLIAHSANVNCTTVDGETPLMLANDVASARMLIEKGSRIDATDSIGRTALHCAASSDRPEIIELLIKSGAKLDVRTKKGETPLDWAKGARCKAAVKALVAAGAK